MQQKLLKYKIGFLALGLFTVGIALFLVLQASATKKDSETYKQAEKTANQLNEYLSQKQAPPSSLEAAGISYDKETVAYKKISSEKYQFCVTYKADGTTIDGTSLLTSVMYTGMDMQPTDDYEDSMLYLSSSHKKGENCQTIKPYSYSGLSDPYFDETDSTPVQETRNPEFDPGFDPAPPAGLSPALQRCEEDTTLSDDAYFDCIDSAYNEYGY